MQHYKKIPIWENNKRIRMLREFRNLIIAYFNNINQVNFTHRETYETEETQRLRREINIKLHTIQSTLTLAGAYPTYHPTNPLYGHLTETGYDLFNNIFNLRNLRVDPQLLTDAIDRAVGIYENDGSKALLRTINPFFWLFLILDYIFYLPFKFIGKFLFGQAKFEETRPGKFFKIIISFVIRLVTFLAGVLTVLHYTGHQKAVDILLNKHLFPIITALIR